MTPRIVPSLVDTMPSACSKRRNSSASKRGPRLPKRAGAPPSDGFQSVLVQPPLLHRSCVVTSKVRTR
jgi:hypothetical protein